LLILKIKTHCAFLPKFCQLHSNGRFKVIEESATKNLAMTNIRYPWQSSIDEAYWQKMQERMALPPIELDSAWHNSGDQWIRALSLPTLEWVRPFLPLLGLPDPVWQQPEQTRKESGEWEVGRDGALDQLASEAVLKALRQLAEQQGQEVAVGLERWVRFSFLCPEAATALSEWGSVLRYPFIPDDSKKGKRKLQPPKALIPLLTRIREYTTLERWQELDEQVKQAAPIIHWLEISGDDEWAPCFEATMVCQAIDRNLMLKVLKILSQALTSSEREEVAEWALAQIELMWPTRAHIYIERLKGAKYLDPEMPWYNLPSLLEAGI
jgi:hypothetical protein